MLGNLSGPAVIVIGLLVIFLIVAAIVGIVIGVSASNKKKAANMPTDAQRAYEAGVKQAELQRAYEAGLNAANTPTQGQAPGQ